MSDKLSWTIEQKGETDRPCEVHINDDHGYHIVEAYGVAGTWYCLTRSAHVGFGQAVYAAAFGETPNGCWELDSGDAPWIVAYNDLDRAKADFAEAERLWSIKIRSNVAGDVVQAIVDYADNGFEGEALIHTCVNVEGFYRADVDAVIKELKP